jgi:penicillin-binding protein 2
VEHGGFGSAIAVPIASLIEEMYLTGTVERPELVERVKAMKPKYGKYDEMQRKYDAKREKK